MLILKIGCSALEPWVARKRSPASSGRSHGHARDRRGILVAENMMVLSSGWQIRKSFHTMPTKRWFRCDLLFQESPVLAEVQCAKVSLPNLPKIRLQKVLTQHHCSSGGVISITLSSFQTWRRLRTTSAVEGMAAPRPTRQECWPERLMAVMRTQKTREMPPTSMRAPVLMQSLRQNPSSGVLKKLRRRRHQKLLHKVSSHHPSGPTPALQRRRLLPIQMSKLGTRCLRRFRLSRDSHRRAERLHLLCATSSSMTSDIRPIQTTRWKRQSLTLLEPRMKCVHC
mmetsp:Transcript_24292/g.44596  ORF Transcript_24292/g.44596 Transcript_24292/m.44596 type:complete len:283 (+) Transcript_24292:210-1058(+)